MYMYKIVFCVYIYKPIFGSACSESIVGRWISIQQPTFLHLAETRPPASERPLPPRGGGGRGRQLGAGRGGGSRQTGWWSLWQGAAARDERGGGRGMEWRLGAGGGPAAGWWASWQGGGGGGWVPRGGVCGRSLTGWWASARGGKCGLLDSLLALPKADGASRALYIYNCFKIVKMILSRQMLYMANTEAIPVPSF